MKVMWRKHFHKDIELHGSEMRVRWTGLWQSGFITGLIVSYLEKAKQSSRTQHHVINELRSDCQDPDCCVNLSAAEKVGHLFCRKLISPASSLMKFDRGVNGRIDDGMVVSMVVSHTDSLTISIVGCFRMFITCSISTISVGHS